MPEKSPLVSVVIPYYNAENTLLQAAQSILNQTYAHLELVLVNNASTDQGEEIASKLAKADKRVVLANEPRKGVAHAANTGMKTATGQYIARMDADDFSLPQRIEKQVKYLEQNPETGVVSCMVQHKGHHENTKGLQRFVDWANQLITHQQIFLNRFIEAPVINPTAMFRRELLTLHGNFIQGDFPEDYELWLRWLDAGVRIEKIPEVLFEWNDSDTRLTRTDPRYRTNAFYQVKANYLSKWLKTQNTQNIWVWGAGKQTRKRVEMLLENQVAINGYIDVKQHNTGTLPCVNYKDFNWSTNIFILSYVGNYGAREKIRSYLANKNKIEGASFIMMA